MVEGQYNIPFKKGNTEDLLHYRPVSLTHIVYKLIVKLMRKRLVEHLENETYLGLYLGNLPSQSFSDSFRYRTGKKWLS